MKSSNDDSLHCPPSTTFGLCLLPALLLLFQSLLNVFCIFSVRGNSATWKAPYSLRITYYYKGISSSRKKSSDFFTFLLLLHTAPITSPPLLTPPPNLVYPSLCVSCLFSILRAPQRKHRSVPGRFEELLFLMRANCRTHRIEKIYKYIRSVSV